MRTLRNYMLKELIIPFFACLFIFLFCLLIGNLLKLADMVVNKGVNIGLVLKILLTLLPFLLTYALPMSLLTAILLSFGRLSSDNEMGAIAASGISFYSIISPFIVLGLILSLLSIPLNDRIACWAHFTARRTAYEIGVENPIGLLEEKRYIRDFKDNIIYIDQIDQKRGKLKSLIIHRTEEGRPIDLIAKWGKIISGKKEGEIVLQLFEVVSYEQDRDNPDEFYKIHFQSYNIPLDLQRQWKKGMVHKKIKEMSISELRREILFLKSEGMNIIPLLIQLYEKISLSFSSLVFILIGLPLAVSIKRGGRTVGFGLSLVIITAYYVFMLAGEALALKGVISPFSAVWLPNIVLGGTGLFLIEHLAHNF